MESLTTEQRNALEQLRTLINGGDDDVSIAVLTSVGWDVQRAAEMVFSDPVAEVPRSSSRPPEVQPMEIDDSEQNAAETYRANEAPAWPITFRSNGLWTLLTFPLHILSNLVRFIFGTLGIPFPQLRFGSLNFYRPLYSTPPSSVRTTEGWVRDLEEEIGAVTAARSSSERGATSSTSYDASNLTSRSRAPEDGCKILPNFTISTYEEALRLCQSEARVGCIILVCDEHDNDRDFKMNTLTNPSLVKLLLENNVMVWGGDVRDREAWGASQKLQATTYPFVAFVALQPRRNPVTSGSRTNTPPSLTVLSRLQGRSTPDSGPTSAHSIIDHLETKVFPRVNPFLARHKAVLREREVERALRDEQDRAFRDSAARDMSRIEARMAAERQAAEERRKEEERLKVEEMARKRAVEDGLAREQQRMEWRRYTRRMIVTPESKVTKGHLRIAVRLPANGRVIRQFAPSSSLTALYAFVDSQLIPADFPPSGDPSSPPAGSLSGETALEAQLSRGADEWWGFRLVTAYPRQEIPWSSGKRLWEIEALKGGAQIVVEISKELPAVEVESDGYDTEGSE